MTKISFLFFYIQAPIREKAHRIKIRQSVKTKTPQVDLTLVSGNGSSHLRESKDILANYKYIINKSIIIPIHNLNKNKKKNLIF